MGGEMEEVGKERGWDGRGGKGGEMEEGGGGGGRGKERKRGDGSETLREEGRASLSTETHMFF